MSDLKCSSYPCQFQEMKWSIKNDVASAERVLDDLEFVVDNVDLTKGQEKVVKF